MYAKIAMLLLVAASAAACAQNDQLSCREVPTEIGVKGPGCGLIVADAEGQVPPDRPRPRDEPNDTPNDNPNDTPDDPRDEPNDNPNEPGGPVGTAPQ